MSDDPANVTVQRISSSSDVLLRDFAYLLHLQNRTDSVEESLSGIHKSLAMFDFLDPNLVKPQSHFFIAHMNGNPAGYIAVQRIPKADARGGFYFVDELFVNERYRRLNVGTDLLHHVQDLLYVSGSTAGQEVDVAGVRLLVRCENHGAQSLYRKVGFNLSTTLFGQYYPPK